MSVLDTMVWVGKPGRTWGIPEAILIPGTSLPSKTGSLKNIVLYKFFRKPVASRTPMNSRSAAPLRDQIQTATNEFLRRMRNTSRELEEHHLTGVLSDYCCDLIRGGYHPNWVHTCIEAACKGYGRMVTEELNGIRPVNRPSHLGKKVGESKLLKGKAT